MFCYCKKIQNKNDTGHVLTFGHGNTDSICSHDSGEGCETAPVEGGNVGERRIWSCPCHFQLKKKQFNFNENPETYRILVNSTELEVVCLAPYKFFLS